MSKKFDIAVLGGGIVGHTLALLLARDRWRVALVQCARVAPSHDIRAYALNQAAHQVLSELRVWPDAIAATPVQQMWVSEADAPAPPPDLGGAAASMAAATASPLAAATASETATVSGTATASGSAPASASPAAHLRFAAPSAEQPLAWIVDVPALEQRLQQALQFQSGIELLDSAPPAALTVICEGKHSSTRTQLGFEYDVRHYAHTAVAARLRCERPHQGVARQWFLGGDVLALLPMEGEQGHLVALVWSLGHERAQALLQCDAPGFSRSVGQACEHALGAMTLQGEPAGWPLQLSSARHWVRPGYALAGDAAHAMHPLAGQGLNVGLGDVAALARLLREREYWREPGDWRLLRRYERERRADFERMAGLTDSLYHLFGIGDSRVQVLRRCGLRAFERMGPLKNWAMRQAMGGSAQPAHRPA